MLEGKRILLGVSGGVAAYKAVLLARELTTRGADLRVAMTHTATRFVGPQTFAALVGTAPALDLTDASRGGELHIELARWAQALVVAPATANLLARLAHGLAEDPISATALAFDGPLFLAPAMHHRMWAHPATCANVATLAARGARLVGPAYGRLASGEEGEGRMSEPADIVAAIEALVSDAGARADLEGLRILVSAGPTLEAIDPVRYLGNRSSGRMGWALATRARERGAIVTLVAGPVALADPEGIEVVHVRSALDMEAAIQSRREQVDAIVMAAAVADFRPAEVSREKLKKRDGDPAPTIQLVRNPDILRGLGEQRRGARPLLVGFAVETTDLLASARQKLEAKRADLIVANHASVAFEGDENEAFLVDAQGVTPTGRLAKRALADRILDVIRSKSRPES